MNGEKANYFLACEKICVVIDNYPNKSETRVRLFNPHLIDVSFESSLQSLIGDRNKFTKHINLIKLLIYSY